MSFHLIFRTIVLISLLSVPYQVVADSIWLKNHGAFREYLSFRDGSLKLYFQKKGEYQELVKVFKTTGFEQAAEIKKTHFPELEQVEQLESWPIEDQDDSMDKARNKEIWPVRAQWSKSYEDLYGQWITQNVGPEFFSQYGISTDCADAVVGLRWIFARIYGLPAANTLADTGDLFTNLSMPRKWKKIPTANEWHKDQLFLTALSYVMDLSSTRTVIRDSYPVSLTRDGLKVGTYIWTQNPESNHVRFISENHFGDSMGLPLYTLTSTTPRAIRSLVREAVIDQDWPVEGLKNFFAFRWAVPDGRDIKLLQASQHHNYSREQYDEELRGKNPSFIKFLIQRLKNNYQPDDLVTNGIQDIINYANARIKIVEDGFAYCSVHGCPEGTDSWEAWSTPSRDGKLLKKFTDIDELVTLFESQSPGLFTKWKQAQQEAKFQVLGIEISLQGLRRIFEQKMASSDPNVSIEKRWGLEISSVLKETFAKFSKILKERTEIIAKTPSEGCSASECFPKNDLWLNLNSYHLDRELLVLFNEYKNYCQMLDLSNCHELAGDLAQEKLVTQAGEFSLFELVENIPLFHSSPAVNHARRWGDLDHGVQAVVLEGVKSFSVAKNGIALINGLEFFDLTTKSSLYKELSGQKLTLTENGIGHLFDETSKSLFRFIEGRKSSDLISNELKGKIKNNSVPSLIESEGNVFFLFEANSGFALTRDNLQTLDVVTEFNGRVIDVKKEGLLILDGDHLSFFDLKQSKLFNLSMDNAPKVRLIKDLKFISYSYPALFLNYDSKDDGLEFPVKVDLIKNTATALDLGNFYRVKTIHSRANQAKLFIEEWVSEEFPQAYAVDWSQDRPVLMKLQNLITSAAEVEGVSLVISEKGGRWDQNRTSHLYEWSGDRPQEKILESGLNPVRVENTGIVFSSRSVTKLGLMRNLSGSMKVSIPGLLEFSSCREQVSGQDNFTIRLSTSFGDYSCFGEVLNLVSSVSLTSFSSMINWSNPLEVEWSKSIIRSNIASGSVVILGYEKISWWSSEK